MWTKLYSISICFTLFVSYGFCQSLTASQKEAVVATLTKELERSYVFPDTARQIVNKLKNALSKKFYDTIITKQSFATQLTKDMHAINPDLHLWVRYDPEQEKSMIEADNDSQKQEEVRRKFFERLAPNYGFVKTEVLDGNIGYIDLRIFNPFPEAKQIAIAAMQFISHTDALIIDLRSNGGGSPEMIKLISSYLFEKSTHLNSFYFRPENRYSETWTSDEVSGSKYIHKPVYVLTSSRTFSAAEEFTYNLKNLKRAVIVGAKTRGGANPVAFKALGHGFVGGIPFGKAINPITKTNWEGVGVQPDIVTKEESAFKQAYIDALEKLIIKATDESKAKLHDVLKKMRVTL